MLLKDAQKILKNHKQQLMKLGVQALFLFGSIARGENTPKSDVDVLVKFDAKKGIFGFIDVKTYLSNILQYEVDLVTKDALHPALKKRVLEEAKHVF